MAEEAESEKKPRVLKKITKTRLKNIGLYYLKRFESSVENLRQVLRRRVNDYAYHTPGFDKEEAFAWIEALLQEFEGYGYLNDRRYAEIKIRDYLAAGKSARYVQGKLLAKGIKGDMVEEVIAEEEYDPAAAALKLARKKRIGPFRPEEQRREMRQKDMAVLVRAGFDYETVCEVLDSAVE